MVEPKLDGIVAQIASAARRELVPYSDALPLVQIDASSVSVFLKGGERPCRVFFHVTRVGRPTLGSTGQPLFFELPGGGRARICTKRDTFPDGRDFVGPGVLPHVEVALTIEEATGERDVTLERGLEVLRKKIGGSSR